LFCQGVLKTFFRVGSMNRLDMADSPMDKGFHRLTMCGYLFIKDNNEDSCVALPRPPSGNNSNM
ncbi:hypothetical protein, partial [Anabaena sp. PCC 7938]|uniref:hypothetical protein n=1 Tax=Anabaena sp. PCC 7938 TaxID=1296340 RepID=UPI0020343F5C